jgi:hypothetical protein
MGFAPAHAPVACRRGEVTASKFAEDDISQKIAIVDMRTLAEMLGAVSEVGR